MFVQPKASTFKNQEYSGTRVIILLQRGHASKNVPPRVVKLKTGHCTYREVKPNRGGLLCFVQPTGSRSPKQAASFKPFVTGRHENCELTLCSFGIY